MKNWIVLTMALVSLEAFAKVERIEFHTARRGTGLQPCQKATSSLNQVLVYEADVACKKLRGEISQGAVYNLYCQKEAALQCICSAAIWVDCEIKEQ